jgi:hypothetical protein
MTLVQFRTDSDGPERDIFINPDYVTDVEADMKQPNHYCHISLMDGRNFRIKQDAKTASKRTTIDVRLY